ncbi:MAG: beta-N-acetylhexosaminidase [Candidatus Lokiarchaeota archaeon]|nr:beta-N-acetylhexosaminidase [Candidatus Lokiarchaeota archaeon]
MTLKKFNIIPEPVNILLKEGAFILNEETLILTDLKVKKIAEQLKQILLSMLGLNINIKGDIQTNIKENLIILKIVHNEKQLNGEGYKLGISQDCIEIVASTPKGLFYCIQTLRQLIPLDNIRKKDLKHEFFIPCVEIEDYPRFQWRGFMLDESRHFFGEKIVKNILDLMAFLKLNKFHWHLTDDQGWRFEINRYPLLTEIGSKREGTITARQKALLCSEKQKIPIDGIPVTGCYTQNELKEIISYATEHHISIIPEIDIPGHTTAILASYPHLSCTGGPFDVSTRFRVHRDVLCVGNNEIFEFLENILDEIVQLFPSKIIHIGGDEVPIKRWKDCPKCQALVQTEGLNDVMNLQPYFTNKIAECLASKDRRIIVWNDILNDDLTSNAICQYWLNNLNMVFNHVREGRDVVMSEMNALYLNYPYKIIPLHQTYNYDPIPSNLEEKFHRNILGLEACLWTEFVPTKEILDWQTFPRLIAVSETAWTKKEKRNYESFIKRLDKFLPLLKEFDFHYPSKEEFLQEQ